MSRLVFLPVLAFLVLLTALPQRGHADKLAFIVGVNEYSSLKKNLSTPNNDASAIEKTLEGLGFKVTKLASPTRTQFLSKWGDLLNSLRPLEDVVVFYFAGHGIQTEDGIYLLPKDTPDESAGQVGVAKAALNFHSIMEELSKREPLATLYILDACRKNPFTPAANKAKKSVLGLTKGLGRLPPIDRTFMMYSADADQEAIDIEPGAAGKQANSPYVRRLLPLLASPDLSLQEIATRVRVQVEQDAANLNLEQRPIYVDGMSGHYYLSQLDNNGKAQGPKERVPGDNFIRLASFATWDENCKARPSPRISTTSALKHGQIILKYESFPVVATQFGKSCDKTVQRGVGVYYVVDNARAVATAVERAEFSVRHWSVSPATTINETFDIDLATRSSRRLTEH
jgi:hypothetical protein